MANEMLTYVSCPNCLNPIDVREHGSDVTCDVCEGQFILRGHLCPNCSSYHETEISLCTLCGTPLSRICRHCKTSNWTGDENCQQCSNPLDVLDAIAGNYLMKTSDRLLDQRKQAKDIQAEEEKASIRRMDELMAMEKVRQEEIIKRLRKQKEQERTTYIILGLVIGSIVVIFVVLGLITLL